VPADYAVEDADVDVHELPPGKYAVWRHVGEYSGLGKAWTDFTKNLQAQGIKIGCGPAFELYISGGPNEPPENTVTELYEPVE
jgi:effector-binding domain-containing protein